MCLFFFLFLFPQHKKDKKSCNFFSKTSFLTSRQFLENTMLGHQLTNATCVLYPKHHKDREKERKIGPVVYTTLGPAFDTNAPNLGPIFVPLPRVYIYIYIYIGIVRNQTLGKRSTKWLLGGGNVPLGAPSRVQLQMLDLLGLCWIVLYMGFFPAETG